VLSLDDTELQILMRAAATIPPATRDQFLRALAIELMARPAEGCRKGSVTKEAAN
jgi:hypothetical protein